MDVKKGRKLPGVEEIEKAILDIAEKLGGFKWLKNGDRVLLKVSSNSGNRYPAVTRPELVTAVANILKSKGAGDVIMADLPGVEAVHHRRTTKKSSSKEIFKKNGLYQAAESGNCIIHGFEEGGYDNFIASKSKNQKHWPGPLMIPNIVNEVQHIIYLNRVSTHVMGGATLSLKNAVGWLREDSRLELHRGGSFMEKCAEINACPEIISRLRLVLSDASIIQSTIGPDMGYDSDIESKLLIGSKNLAMHDVAAYNLLEYARREHTPSVIKIFDPYPGMSNFINKKFVGMTWDSKEVESYVVLKAPKRNSSIGNPIIKRGIEIFSPGAPSPIITMIGDIPEAVKSAMNSV